jgi:hypothetical protein
MALAQCFPGRVVPEPLVLLGFGLAHARADRTFEWTPSTDAWAALRGGVFDDYYRGVVELSYLSDPLERGPVTNLTVERRFKTSLEEWQGAASDYPPPELERVIYDTHLNEIGSLVLEALASHDISTEEFARLGERRWRAFLDDMPWQRADMHLIRQWAKNADLKPQDSDLNDWTFLAVAVSYCDIVVTENQMASLFSRSRGFDTRAKVISKLRELPELMA